MDKLIRFLVAVGLFILAIFVVIAYNIYCLKEWLVEKWK